MFIIQSNEENEKNKEVMMQKSDEPLLFLSDDV